MHIFVIKIQTKANKVFENSVQNLFFDPEIPQKMPEFQKIRTN